MSVEVTADTSKKGFKSALRALSPGRTRDPQPDGEVGGVRSSGEKGKGDKRSKDKGDKSSKDKGDKSSTGKTWLGAEKKKPRAEYQAKIDELNAKVKALETDRDQKAAQVYQLTQQINSFSMWMRQSPRVS